MLLNRASLGLAKLAPKDESRYTLQGICVDRECTTVTNGHYLITVKHSAERNERDYPETPGLEHRVFSDGPMMETALLARETALAALKAIPRKSTIPVLQFAAMSTDGRLFVNQLDSVQTFKSELKGTFPNWRAILPTKDPVAQIAFDARYLKLLADYFIEHGQGEDKNVIRMTLYGETEAVRIDSKTDDGQEIVSLLMPCRVENKNFPQRPDEIRARELAEAKAKEDAEAAANEASDEALEAA